MTTTARHRLHPMIAATGLLFTAAFIAGCGAQSADFGKHAATPAKPVAARPLAKHYRFAEKAAFITDMSAELAGITREFDRLFPRVDAASTRMQSDVVPTIETLRGLSGTLYRRLDEARTATESEWPAMTADFRRDLGRLNAGLEQSRQKLSGPDLR